MFRRVSLVALLASTACFADPKRVAETVVDDGEASRAVDTGGSSASSSVGTTQSVTSTTTDATGEATDDGTEATGSDTTGGGASYCLRSAPAEALLCDDFDGDPLRPTWTVTMNDGGIIERRTDAALSSDPNGLASIISGDANSTATALQTFAEDWTLPVEIGLTVQVDQACQGPETRLFALGYIVPGEGASYPLIFARSMVGAVRITERSFGDFGSATAHESNIFFPVEGPGRMRVIVQGGDSVGVEMEDVGPDTFALALFPETLPAQMRVNPVLGITTGTPVGPCRVSMDDVVVALHP